MLLRSRTYLSISQGGVGSNRLLKGTKHIVLAHRPPIDRIFGKTPAAWGMWFLINTSHLHLLGDTINMASFTNHGNMAIAASSSTCQIAAAVPSSKAILAGKFHPEHVKFAVMSAHPRHFPIIISCV